VALITLFGQDWPNSLLEEFGLLDEGSARQTDSQRAIQKRVLTFICFDLGAAGNDPNERPALLQS